jgi:hypothetical protein
MVPGKVVVPLPAVGSRMETVSVPGLGGSITDYLNGSSHRTHMRPTSISVRESTYDIGYSATFHKTQGLTLKDVFLSLSPNALLTLCTVHVALSRVKFQANLKIMPGSLEHLRKLVHDPHVVAWTRALRVWRTVMGVDFMRFDPELFEHNAAQDRDTALAAAAAAAAAKKTKKKSVPVPLASTHGVPATQSSVPLH